MTDLFKNKYLVGSARNQKYDYGNTGAYFVTINTAGRVPYFGKLEKTKMILSKQGEIAVFEWKRSEEMRKDMHLKLSEFICMTDHFHGILIIQDNEFNSSMPKVSTIIKEDENFDIPDVFIPKMKPNRFGPQSKNLASIIRGFKSAVTTQCKKNGLPFGWQASYHCRFIESLEGLEKVKSYIRNNGVRHAGNQ